MNTPYSTKNFAAVEVSCSCCGEHGIRKGALNRLQHIRETLGRPLRINSAYRCSDHPAEAKKAKPGQHHLGVAFDIACSNGAGRMEIVKAALDVGATGIGIHSSFVHVDFRESTEVLWLY